MTTIKRTHYGDFVVDGSIDVKGGYAHHFTTMIGDGATLIFDIVHNLSSLALQTSFRDNLTVPVGTFAIIAHKTLGADTLRVEFRDAPATDQFTVNIMAIAEPS